jgi:hypothetical protein
MDAVLPKTQEEFNLYFFTKLNEMDKSNETLHGDVRVAIANHNALEKRVGSVEDDAKEARKWENIKFAGAGFVQGVIIWFKHSGAVHTAQSIASVLGF